MATEKSPNREIAEAEQERKPPSEREENIDEDTKRTLAIAATEVVGAGALPDYDYGWSCKLCGKQSVGLQALMGHFLFHRFLLGDDRVRSEAGEALKAKIAVESSNGRCDVEEGPHQPATASNEDATAAMPYVSSGVISTAVCPLPQPFPFTPAGRMMTETHSSFDPVSLVKIIPPNADEGESSIGVLPHDARTQSKPSTCGPAIENMKSIKRKREELTSRGVENMNESKWRKLKGCCSLGQAVKEFKEILPILERFLQETTTLAKGCSRRSPLVTTELVGGGTHRKINEIYSYLVQENISIIGVVGMVGVGKTAILTHVHNKLLENRAFDDVLWVNVPLEFSTYALQEEIANVVGLHNISNEKDVKRRASILYGHLRMKKSVLILDGLWMHFKVKDVGIPVEMGSVKLVLSTRSLDVCFMMLCQKQIKIKPLEREESWRLFLKVLCFAGKLPSDIEEIAKFIMHKCDGLPLGIIDIGTRMRGVEKVHEWKGMLQKFKDSRIELEAFKGLKLSYMNLGDHQVQ
ncbi:probable disease resistance protein At4g27220 [Eucalyptus grandis]|uniref:probable disease resistance protein At4g27220 n=1 Tax=Eucalyptus grandis TaxID=71139 RepID=UPI00192F0704|nr:probable disease resistance protein At4g27220 [Eucalyptus grandis]